MKASNLWTAVFGLDGFSHPKYLYSGWRGFVVLFVDIPLFNVEAFAPLISYFCTELYVLFFLLSAPSISFVIREKFGVVKSSVLIFGLLPSIYPISVTAFDFSVGTL